MAIGAPAPGRMTPLSFRKNVSMLRGPQLAVFRRASVVINETARQQAGAGAPERTSREPDDPSRLPTPAAVEAVLRLSDFVDFQQQLEQLHDYIHVWVGGTVGEVPFAAYDPIFF